MKISTIARARHVVAPLTVGAVLAALAVSSPSTGSASDVPAGAGEGSSVASTGVVGLATAAEGGTPGDSATDDPGAVVDDVPVYVDTPCADFARSESADPTVTDKWLCIGDVLTTTDPITAEQEDLVLDEEGEVEGPATQADLQNASEVAEIDGVPSSAGQLQLVDRVDDYHAKKTVGVGWRIGSTQGWVNYSYSIGISNHSADVAMSYFETTGKSIIMTWKLRIRHDVRLGGDDTVFTYPNVQGPSYYTRSYNYTEGRYGDGYNQLPYESDWKLFWDSYKISIRYAATNVNSDNTAQSDRVTCYKTVSCKFK